MLSMLLALGSTPITQNTPKFKSYIHFPLIVTQSGQALQPKNNNREVNLNSNLTPHKFKFFPLQSVILLWGAPNLQQHSSHPDSCGLRIIHMQ